jgi:hypothetical protein
MQHAPAAVEHFQGQPHGPLRRLALLDAAHEGRPRRELRVGADVGVELPADTRIAHTDVRRVVCGPLAGRLLLLLLLLVLLLLLLLQLLLLLFPLLLLLLLLLIFECDRRARYAADPLPLIGRRSRSRSRRRR